MPAALAPLSAQPLAVRPVASGRRVMPFDEPVGELPVLGRPLTDWQRQAVAGAGLRWDPEAAPPYLELSDALFVTAAGLRAFVDGAAGRDAALVLGRSAFGAQVAAAQPGAEAVDAGWRLPGLRLVSGRGDAPVDVVIDPDEELQEVPRPACMGGPLRVPLARVPVVPVHHWAHLLAAQRAAQALPLREAPRWRLGLRLLGAALRARSLNKWRVLAALSEVGPRCDVHPTALIEGSTLGPGVTVGAHAQVRFSEVAAGATIMPDALVEGCHIGAGALVGRGAAVRFSLLMPGAAACAGAFQMGVMGRDSFTTQGAWLLDSNFDHDVMIELDGALHSSGSPFLGVALGHGCRVGAGVYIAAGRALPAGTTLVRAPEGVLRRPPAGPGAAGVVRGGAFSPLPARPAAPDSPSE
jgi:carbonic anhydrase/acetyltransferase-like protein (isoleucine patch superfamily)